MPTEDTLRRVVVSANVVAAVLSGVAAVLARRNPALLVGGRVSPNGHLLRGGLPSSAAAGR
jgi:hypothetical protein